MSYKALYRTYRPQTFEDVAGQKSCYNYIKKMQLKENRNSACLFILLDTWNRENNDC